MKRLVALCVLLSMMLPAPLFAAITADAANGATGTTSATGDATIAADANYFFACVMSRDSGGAVQAPTGVTVGGDPMLLLDGAAHSGGVIYVSVFYKLAPLTGTRQVVATGHASNEATTVAWASYKGVAQSNTHNTVDTATSGGADNANMDVDGIASAVGELGLLCGAHRTETITASADGTAPVSTEVFEKASTVSPGGVAVIYQEAGASPTVDMRVDLTASTQWIARAVSIRAAADTAGMKMRSQVRF